MTFGMWALDAEPSEIDYLAEGVTIESEN